MSLVAARNILRDKAEDQGFEEWRDAAFFTGDVPEQNVDDLFHIENGIGPQVLLATGQTDVFTQTNLITIRFFKRGGQDPVTALEDLLTVGEDYLKVILDPEVRKNTTGVKDIIPLQISPVPIAGTNDETIVLEIQLNVETIICPTNTVG